jgi:D-sedoheptulose 7-phosphate isomerase
MFKARLGELVSSLDACEITSHLGPLDLDQGLSFACQLIRETKSHGGIVYVIGNGGSAGIASHFCNDLMKAHHVPSQTFYDSNLMTCLANDLGYEQIFSFPLEKLLTKNDLLVAISSSGKSANILNAAAVAVQKSASLITLSGFQNINPLRTRGGLNFWINRSDYGLVESAHFFLLHTIVDLWNQYSLKDLLGATCQKQ